MNGSLTKKEDAVVTQGESQSPSSAPPEAPSSQLEPHPLAPPLSESEQQQVEQRAAIPAAVVHEAIRKEGEAELRRPSVALAWSGLAAGLSMGFSLVAEGLIKAHLPNAPWQPLLT